MGSPMCDPCCIVCVPPSKIWVTAVMRQALGSISSVISIHTKSSHMKPVLTATLHAWSLITAGDFASTLARCSSAGGLSPPPLAVAKLPGGRQVFFVSSPLLVAEAAVTRSSDFRDRQDEDAGRPGVVGAVGQCWARRRERLRFLQSRELLETIAPPAVAAALQHASATLPSSALSMPVNEFLQHCTVIVRRSLHRTVLNAQPSDGGSGSLGMRWQQRRHTMFGSLSAPAVRQGRWLVGRLAALSLLCEQVWAMVRGASFFELAHLYTSRQRKVQRRTSRYCEGVAWLAGRRRGGRHVGGRGGGGVVAQPDWIESAVLERCRATSEPQAQTTQAQPEAARSAPSSLLDALVAPSSGRQETLDSQEVLDVVRDVLVAGAETTSETLVAAAMLLRSRPDVAAKVAEEAKASSLGLRPSAGTAEAAASQDDDAATHGPSTEVAAAFQAAASPSALPYSRAVLLEATRLHPAAPLLLRVARRDTSLGGVCIPEGSGLVASTAMLGRDGGAWEAPDAFVPERFLDGHPQHRSAEGAKAYLAFGSGPRSCVGQQLALTIASLALSSMALAAADEEEAADAEYDAALLGTAP